MDNEQKEKIIKKFVKGIESYFKTRILPTYKISDTHMKDIAGRLESSLRIALADCHKRECIEVKNKNASFILRLWHLISNPFYYLFKGKWRI